MKITPLKVLRIDANKTLRPSVAFQFTEKSPVPVPKKVSVGVGKRKISRTQLQLSEEWKVWRTQLHNSRRSLWLEVEGSSSGTERRTSPVRKCEGVSVDMHSMSESLT
ncbi:hypothetical protein TNCV_4042021 [Trichonephila clavipes]|nr:hypothetical protein TNCV_4042021 [Trichonephila clavipes]